MVEELLDLCRQASFRQPISGELPHPLALSAHVLFAQTTSYVAHAGGASIALWACTLISLRSTKAPPCLAEQLEGAYPVLGPLLYVERYRGQFGHYPLDVTIKPLCHLRLCRRDGTRDVSIC